MAHPAAESADNRHAKTQQPVRDRSGIHYVGCDDEKRHGQQNETLVCPGKDLLAGECDVLARDRKICHRRQDDRERDRHADGGQAKQGDEPDSESKAHMSPTCCLARSSGAPCLQMRTNRMM